MAKKSSAPKIDPIVAATLTGIIYQARLFNRQARVNVPEEEVVVEVISLWRIVSEALDSGTITGTDTPVVPILPALGVSGPDSRPARRC